MAWIIVDAGVDAKHIVPEDEAEQHALWKCKCGSWFNTDADAYVHNSFDGREGYENGTRRPH